MDQFQAAESSRIFKKEKKLESKSYFDLSAKEKKEIIKKAAEEC